ncbi:sigma-54-dependent Fis family transcriptional regulator [Lentibacillus sp. CBA3610]|uniref:sigma-54 interaction domain-containing protein n=1 Tax=Lentibacillus sp. CBA3610 TaxID=2518176 RepID=UPI001595CBD4|nr:sigma 54-interacting transcriptional regulator [Lentibacillus sp. CBA3610]QKY71705.1 PAS domain S-box protein [Lentibacillus sp. CBA3610]
MNALHQQLIDAVDIGIHVIDQNGDTVIYNKKMMEIESMGSDDVLDKNLLDVFKFSDNQSSTLVEAMTTGKTTKNAKQTYFNNKGKEITTINNSFPIIENGEITGAVEIAKDVTQLEHVIKENVLNKQNSNFTFDKIIGSSTPVQVVIDEAKRATRTSSSVMIAGETGTGKELFAQSIHNGSKRSSAPFISQNCAAIPDNLMESLLFGTKKGAFTGAVDRSGLFEQADGGTLLLDEINSLDPALQAKLLRVIQEKSIRRIGDIKDKKVNVRIITTINEDPVDAIADGQLRKDLFYRLSVVSLFVPPLRERKEDIDILTQHFIDKYNAIFEMDIKGINSQVKKLLRQHDWPGNVRELEHTIEAAMNLILDEDTITVNSLPAKLRKKYQQESDMAVQDLLNLNGSTSENQSLKDKMTAAEKLYIQQALAEHNHNVSHTAKILGISRQSLQYRMRKFGV